MRSSRRRPARNLFRNFDLPFRVRRLRFPTRRLAEMEEPEDAPRRALRRAREIVYDFLGRYQGAGASAADDLAFAATEAEPEQAMAALAAALDLKTVDDEADARLTEVLAEFPRAERRSLILAYLGFPFYDIATLPLLQGEGLDEFDLVKVDRIWLPRRSKQRRLFLRAANTLFNDR
ncbi:MAG TPA: hypothetical protein VGF77_13965 [Allosphingosinicella sp.]|jgi:DNA-directed RNA polymerase specialized sigma24 family protein